jgi:hypothetical protein
MKILGYILIIIGIVFTIGMFYIIITVEEWEDIIIGWLFLGPLPLGIGIFILKKLKSIPLLNLFSKLRK